MNIFTKEEVLIKKDEILRMIADGAVFIYPTDTIYGLGCNAMLADSVERIRKLKRRKKSPFSVIAPTKSWIKQNCYITKRAAAWLKKLPGPYTLILRKRRKCVASNVAPGIKTLGVRIPNHWFARFIAKLKIPIITTSANVAGSMFMTSLENLDSRIKHGVDFIIYEGPIAGKPSKIIDLTGKEEKILR